LASVNSNSGLVMISMALDLKLFLMVSFWHFSQFANVLTLAWAA
jgi:hypothetical protein